MTETRVRVASETDRESWDQYITEKGLSHHCYCWYWKSVIGNTFGHEMFYLIAERSSESSPRVVGVLPLAYVKSSLFGRALISLPYLNGGGIVANDNDVQERLLAHLKTLAQQLSVDYVELRHREAIAHEHTTLQVRSHKVAMTLPLNSSAEQLFSSFPAKLRSQIRRPTKTGMHAEVSGNSGADPRLLNAFYSVFAQNMRDLGTPVYPRTLFWETIKQAGSHARVIVIWKNDLPAAAGITIGFGKHVEIPWASALKQFKSESPNMLLYWQALKTACDDGYSVFDFGRCSPNSGPFQFKEQWGAVPQTLHWHYLSELGEIPDVNPKSSRFRMLVSCWRRLPLPVANLIGPWLTKSIP